jgi:hypothetical protein
LIVRRAIVFVRVGNPLRAEKPDQTEVGGLQLTSEQLKYLAEIELPEWEITIDETVVTLEELIESGIVEKSTDSEQPKYNLTPLGSRYVGNG